MFLVVVDSAAMSMVVQLSADRFFVVAEKLTFVEWEEVAGRLLMALIILGWWKWALHASDPQGRIMS